MEEQRLADRRFHRFRLEGLGDPHTNTHVRGFGLAFDLTFGREHHHGREFVAGGAQMLDNNGFFNIGERNFAVFRKIMWKNKMLISASDIGGNNARTMRLFLEDGKVLINTNEEKSI